MTLASPRAAFAGESLAREGLPALASLLACGCSMPCQPGPARRASDPPVDDDDDDDDFLRKRDPKVDDDNEDEDDGDDEDDEDEDDEGDTVWTRAALAPGGAVPPSRQ